MGSEDRTKWCEVCGVSWNYNKLVENYRGYLECPECGTELMRSRSYDGLTHRDSLRHK